MMSAGQRRAAVVGVGLLGEQHAEHDQRKPSTQLTLVPDVDRHRARAVGERRGVPWTTSLEDLATSDVEIVRIATSDHLHLDVADAMIDELLW
jgi:predicted dehydrogenase